MIITTRKVSGITILDLSGRLTSGGGTVKFSQTMQQVLGRNTKQILINLQGLDLMDSSGLGELVRTKQSAICSGATLKLLHVEDKVLEVFRLGGKTGVFDVFDDEIDAISSF